MNQFNVRLEMSVKVTADTKEEALRKAGEALGRAFRAGRFHAADVPNVKIKLEAHPIEEKYCRYCASTEPHEDYCNRPT